MEPEGSLPCSLDPSKHKPTDLCNWDAVCFLGGRKPREITNSMEQSPSWKADSHSASQEIPCLLCNAKFHYRVHNIPPLVPVLSHMNPVHTFPTYFPNNHSNIIFASTPVFRPKFCMHFSSLSRVLHDHIVYKLKMRSEVGEGYDFSDQLSNFHGYHQEIAPQIFATRWNNGLSNILMFISLCTSVFPFPRGDNEMSYSAL
jgi:hypothetical protein